MKILFIVRVLLVYSIMMSIFFTQFSHSNSESTQFDKNDYAYDEMLVFHLKKWNFSMNIDNNGYAQIARGSQVNIPMHFYPAILDYERVLDDLDLEPLSHDEALQYWKDDSKFIYITRHRADGEESNYKTRSLDVVAHCLVAVANARLQPAGRATQLREYLNLSFVTDAHLNAENNLYVLKNYSGTTSDGEEKEETEDSRSETREPESAGVSKPAQPPDSPELAEPRGNGKEFRWIIYALLPVVALFALFLFKFRRQAK